MKLRLSKRWTQILVVASSLSGCSALSASDRPASRYPAPSQVLVRGSDIETEAHDLTLKLRDSLEQEVASRASQAVASGDKTSIYLPEDVQPVTGGFRYRVLLVDAQLKTLRSTRGKCSSDEIRNCASSIVGRLSFKR